MDILILIAAAWGIVLLWHRAKPLKPVREWLIVRLHRTHEWIRSLAGKRPIFDDIDTAYSFLNRAVAYPFFWLVGVLGCGECMTPYVAFALCLGYGFTVGYSLVGAAAAYAGWVCLFAPKDHEP